MWKGKNAKKGRKKTIECKFCMYVLARYCEMLLFFPFFLTIVLIDNYLSKSTLWIIWSVLATRGWKKLPQHLSPIFLRSCAFVKCLQLVCCTEQIKLWEAIGWIKQYFCWTCWTPFVPSALFSLPVRCVGFMLLKMFWRGWWIGLGAQRGERRWTRW